MGLRSEINNDIKEAFDTDLSDAVKKFKAVRTIKGQSTDDDWLSNTVGNTQTTLTYTGRGVFSSYAEIEVDNESIRMNDVKLIILQSEIGKEPMLDDMINGYQVLAVGKDPADVTYTLQLRKV